jgi:hypothetical protein
MLLEQIAGEEEEDDSASLLKKSEASFQFLADWYGNQYPTVGAPRPPLVLVIQVSFQFLADWYGNQYRNMG